MPRAAAAGDAVGCRPGGRMAASEPRPRRAFRGSHRFARKYGWLLSSLLATGALLPSLSPSPALAEECAAGSAPPPSDVASPAKLYDRLRASTDADLLAIEFDRRLVAETCAWVYSVKVLTTAGAVVELDFAANSLDLVGARGPANDHAAADLARRLGAGDAVLSIGSPSDDAAGSSAPAGPNQANSSSGQGAGSNDDGSEGEGGESGSGSSGSGGGDSGSGDSGSGGSGSGDSGSGGSGGGSDGGEGGDGGDGGDSGDGGN